MSSSGRQSARDSRTRRMPIAVAVLIAALFVLGPGRAARAALDPSEIALVVNDQVPESRDLAAYYAIQRHIPAGRIIGLSLRVRSLADPDEEIPFADYESQVAEPIRQFLQKNGLELKVRCLVTFWGVPLRIGRRAAAPIENEEVSKFEVDFAARLRPQLQSLVVDAEALAAQLQPDFHPDIQKVSLEELEKRADAASHALLAQFMAMPNDAKRGVHVSRFLGIVERLIGSDELLVKMTSPPFAALAPIAVTPAQIDAAERRLRKVRDQLQADAPTAADRLAQRNAAQQLGFIGYITTVREQVARLNPKESESALDSELSLLWWHGHYPRARWVSNSLYWRIAASPNHMTFPGPAVMVCRLDAATPQIVRHVIDTSIQVEEKGLSGQLAVDARGRPASDPYGAYDQTLRNLAAIAKAKTSLQVTLDDQEAVFAPGSVQNVALYCGWYSVRNYVPGCRFVAGAVGFHVASFELVSLRAPGERGWVRGLMGDGVVATLGPVAEPYLHSFPRADEFFPLLMTGRLSFAEVYWRTCPLASWMETCIGDPLYNPYRAHPAIKIADLPQPLGLALQIPSATTGPSATTIAPAAPTFTHATPGNSPTK